jgi:homoserine dehydrogenase
MAIDSAGMALDRWQDKFANSASALDLQGLTDRLAAMEEDTVVFDCTASDVPCDYYAKWMSQGVHVITPNKKLHSGPIERYNEVRKLQAEGAAHYFYEVGIRDQACQICFRECTSPWLIQTPCRHPAVLGYPS